MSDGPLDRPIARTEALHQAGLTLYSEAVSYLGATFDSDCPPRAPLMAAIGEYTQALADAMRQC